MHNKILLIAVGILIFVSLIGIVYADGILNTCVQDKDGAFCMEYPANLCNSKCTKDCVPTNVTGVRSCKMGICLDSATGECSINSVKSSCEINQGTWFDETDITNVPACRKGCCILGSQASLMTEQQCRMRSSSRGLALKFNPNINSELSCFGMSNVQGEGACVISSNGQKNCKLNTKSDCNALNGQFHPGILCSNPTLNTSCTRQAKVACVGGKDEVYWFDSCNNRENIYDSNVTKSWNGGRVLAKNASCSLSYGASSITNSASCGNCNKFEGSVCGLNQNVNVPKYSCNSLKCKDENGKTRENGESWCNYQGATGTAEGVGGFSRSVDTVGSRQFKKVCINGQIRTDPCADYRGEICIQSNSTVGGRTVSGAKCIKNDWNSCISYNEDLKGKKGGDRDTAVDKLKTKCNDNPSCFYKQTDLLALDGKKYFAADLCLPRFAPGFDLTAGSKDSEACNKASNTYKATSNTTDLVGEINDICISMGDCGAKANYAGDLTQNYIARKDKTRLYVSTSYAELLRNYAETLFYVPTIENYNLYIKKTGSGTITSTPKGINCGKTCSFKYKAGTMVTLKAKASSGYTFGGWTGDCSGKGSCAINMDSQKSVGVVFTATPRTSSTNTRPLNTISPTTTTSTSGTSIIKKAKFTCDPWEPIAGGAKCSLCGKDGLPCSKYSCMALGKNCKLINEDTKAAQCVEIATNDVIRPKLTPLNDVLLEGYAYDNLSDSGVRLIGPQGGCLQELQPITFGIVTDENAYCRYDFESNEFDNMSQEFTIGGLNVKNHTQIIFVPSLDSLGVSGEDPNRVANFNIYVRCSDVNNNVNDADYIINTCVKPGDDLMLPRVNKRLPELEYARYNSSSFDASVYINKPAECRWSAEDNNYGNMTNQMDCANGIEDMETDGWRCDTTFPLSNNDSMFYIKCMDQPWLVESSETGQKQIMIITQDDDGNNVTQIINVSNSRKRNEMHESYPFAVRKAQSPLKIDSINIDNQTMSVGQEPVTLDVMVRTSGGVNGSAKCSYLNGNSYEEFYYTGGNIHEQLLRFAAGSQTLNVMCEDIMGDSTSGIARIRINVDRSPPEVTRIFANSDVLNLITNENSECRFVRGINDSCGFAFANGTLMTGINNTAHTMSFNQSLTSYIKCMDLYGNNPGSSCSIIVARGINFKNYTFSRSLVNRPINGSNEVLIYE